MPPKIFGQSAPTTQGVTQRFQGATSQDQSVNFGNALQELLKRAQGMGTANFAQQGFNAQDQQTQRQAYTAPGLIGASPGVQASARGAEASALNPTIQAANRGAQTFSEQLGGLKEGINSTLDLLKQDQAQQDKERDDARQLVNQALQTFGSKGFDVIDQKYLKLAGYNPETINLAKQTLKEKELEQKVANNSGSRKLSPTEAQSLGVPYGTTEEQAYGKMPVKPLTEAQGKDLTYANRASNANDVINNMEKNVALYNPAAWVAATTAENTTLGNKFVPDEIKQIRQAERDFSTAILRRESGATINPSEFAVQEKQYFPRPGDDQKTLAQKALLRKTAIDSFKQSAGTSAFPDVNTNTAKIRMTGPKGIFDVPQDKVTIFEQNGYKRI